MELCLKLAHPQTVAFCSLSHDGLFWQVAAALSEDVRDRIGIVALRRHLQSLQTELGTAHERLHVTQVRCFLLYCPQLARRQAVSATADTCPEGGPWSALRGVHDHCSRPTLLHITQLTKL